MILRHLQQCGHKPIILLGGGTTKVGDPSGKDASRKMLSNGPCLLSSELSSSPLRSPPLLSSLLSSPFLSSPLRFALPMVCCAAWSMLLVKVRGRVIEGRMLVGAQRTSRATSRVSSRRSTSS